MCREFVVHVHAVVEIITRLRTNLDEERRGLTTRWGERQGHIDDLAEQLALVYGGLKSIGAKMPMVASLELSAPTPLPLPDAHNLH